MKTVNGYGGRDCLIDFWLFAGGIGHEYGLCIILDGFNFSVYCMNIYKTYVLPELYYTRRCDQNDPYH
jgi:hypothetical protein